VESDFARDSLSSPFLVADTVDTWDHEQTSQEFQLSGALFGDRVDYVAGLFYMDEEGTNDNLVDTSIGDLGSGGSIDNTVWAVFGQGNLSITDSLVGTLGVRYTDEEKKFIPGFRGGDQLFFSDANGLALGLPPTLPLIIPGTYKRDDDSTDFALALKYNFTDELMSYVSFTTGFKSGGFSQRIGPGPGVPAPEFRPEEVETAEIGFKWQGLEDALRLNGAVFFSDYTDLQVAPIFEGIGPVTRNIGDAEIWGGELEWSYAPTDALTFSGGLGYLHDEIKSLTPEATTNIALDGTQVITLDTQLAKTPKFSANAELAYIFSVGSSGEIGARVNWSYTDKLFNDVLNTPELERDSLHLLGLRLSYEHVNSGWIIAVQGNNLTDEEYIVAGNAEIAGGQFGYIQGTYARPREWWASVRKNF
jgi:iron complex outermembrane receptor protein